MISDVLGLNSFNVQRSTFNVRRKLMSEVCLSEVRRFRIIGSFLYLLLIASACIFFFWTPIQIHAESLNSTNFTLVNYDMDDGSTYNATSESNQMVLQYATSVCGTSNSDSFQLIHGLHFSSDVTAISGYVLYTKGSVTINATAVGLITTRVEYLIKINNASATNLAYDEVDLDSLQSGWKTLWNTLDNVTVTAQISLLARAYDGLSWGNLMEISSPFYVDNEVPVIQSLSAQYSYFSPNYSPGVKDTDTLTFALRDSFCDSWTMRIKSGATTIKEYTNTFTLSGTYTSTWDGKNSSDQFVADQAYTYELTVTDKAGNSITGNGTFTVDNTPPTFTSSSLVATGMDTNSGRGTLSASWVSTDNFNDQLLYDFYYAASPYLFTSKSLDQVTNTSWTESNLNDITYYKGKILATDEAGNTTEQQTNIAFTPDRTAPVISDSFNDVNGIENISWSQNLSAYKSDNYYSGSNLAWTITEYTTQENATKARTRNLFVSMPLSGDMVTFNLALYANTDSTLAYNRYGYPGATFKLKLTDASGNYTQKDIVANVTHVNQAPTLITRINDAKNLTGLDGDVLAVSGNYVPTVAPYAIDFYTLEDTVATTVTLDAYVDDVDNPTSSLAWVVSDNAHIAWTVGNAGTGHRLTLTPQSHWYGQVVVTISVTDGEVVPTHSYASQQLLIRVWPVNNQPVIDSAIYALTTTANYKDYAITLNLSSYKSDTEDRLDELTWSCTTYNTTYISRVTKDADIFVFTPITHKYGTTPIIMTLTDKDEIPKAIFPRYISAVLSVTANLNLTWIPTNNIPVIGDIAAQTVYENGALWILNLADKKSDIEDPASDLTWGVTIDKSNLLTISLNGDVVQFTPVTHAWGTANVTFTLTDKDTGIDFTGYVPNPKTATLNVSFKVMAVNDIPTLTTINVTIPGGYLGDRIKASDTLTVTPVGYTDIGYTSDTREASAIGDEYGPASASELNFSQNTKKYNYIWKLNNVTSQNALGSTATTNAFTISSDDGKTILLEVAPQDGVDTGTTKTLTFKINTRPTIVVPNTPQGAYYVTKNIVITWNASTDADSDLIDYRIKVWKVSGSTSPTPSMDNTADLYWDSGWRNDYIQVDSTSMTFTGGYYYWACFSGNKFNESSTGYDYRIPDWIRKFQIQVTMPSMNDLIGNKEIVPTGSIPISGRYQVLYGHKPAYTAVWLSYYNERKINDLVVTINDFSEIVPLDELTEWTYMAEYPEGRTTYNIFLRDMAGNFSQSYEFVVADDTTPPPAPDIGTTSGLNFDGSTYTSITNNYTYTILGTKEEGSGIWFNDGAKKTQVVPFTNEPTFSFVIRSERPSGVITSKDKAANESPGLSIAITFVLGSPTITATKSREIMNTVPNVSGLSDATKAELAQSTITWSCNRDITSYSLIQSDDSSVIQTGGAVSSGSISTAVIPASILDKGDNTILLKVIDIAQNEGTLSLLLTRDEVAPTINCTSWFNKNGRAYIMGTLEGTETIYINGSTSNVTLSGEKWFYQNNTFPFSSTDITITARDSAYNESTKVEWNHLNYAELQTAVVIAQIIENGPLPDNILALRSLKMNQGLTTAQSVSSLTLPHEIYQVKTAQPEIIISQDLMNTFYLIYAKKFDGTYTQDVDLTGYNTKINIIYDKTVRIKQDYLQAVYFNQTTQLWEKQDIKTTIDKERKIASLIIPKTGIWGLAEYRPFATDLKTMRIYPNPWKPNSPTGAAFEKSGGPGVVFDQLPENTRIRIYTISGQLVKDIQLTNSTWTWDGKNQSDQEVASDVYLYLITSGTETKKGKLTIIR